MNIEKLLEKYRSGEQTPKETIDQVYDRVDTDHTNVWISIRDKEEVVGEIENLSNPSEQPLYGIPFAVKDNIDFNGSLTTVGCPDFAYQPDENATVVNKLVAAGALLIGKTNMDQFATGLVGTRSPYGACHNVHNKEYISGGSSSGSALAVARGEVAFALGTDTAGSGRVPAAFNSIVGLKPSRGMVSNHGVFPACASLDCVSVFANSCLDAIKVESVIAGYDRRDGYSTRLASNTDFEIQSDTVTDVVVGIPDREQIEFFGDTEAAQLYEDACALLRDTYSETKVVDFEPFINTAELLYGGPWLAERLEAAHDFVMNQTESLNPVVTEILTDGKEYTAIETFRAFHELAELKQECSHIFEEIDVLVTPTTGTKYTIEEIREQPIQRNSNLGFYTDYVNLLDLSAVAIPTASFETGPGFGVTVLGSKGDDPLVASVGNQIHTLAQKRTPSAVNQ